jgi:hypothetical protein
MARSPVLALMLAAALVATALVALTLLGRAPAPDTEAALRAVGAKAFARVNSTGVMDAQRSRNVRGVTRDDVGLYCLDLAVSVKNVVATLNAGSAGVASAGLELVDGNSSCRNDTTDVFVLTFNLAGSQVNEPFYVVMH